MPAPGQLGREPPSPLSGMGPAVAPRVATPDTPPGERYSELDGHRGVAVIAVVIFHVYQFSNVDHFLYLGTPGYTVLNSLDAMIPWFFVITAFLLFEPIARAAIERRPAVSFRGFLTRRALRLIPLYYVAVVVVWFSRQQSLPGDWRDLLEHLTFTQVFDEKRIFYTIGPAWAISVEAFFYLILAVLGVGLARTCRRLTGRRQRISVLAGTTTALALISLAFKGWSFAVGHQPTTGSFTTWFGPLANLDNFAVGMAVAVLAAALGGTRPLGPRARLAMRLGGLAILSVAFATRQADAWTGVYFSTICAIGFGCLVAGAVLGPPRDRWSATMSRRPLLWLGAISYSIYLWHEPIMLSLRGSDGLVRQAPGAFPLNTAVVVVVSVVVGWLSYVVIERSTSQLAGMFGRDGRLLPSSRTSGERGEWESFRSGNPI